MEINTHHIIPAFRGDNRSDYREFFKEVGVNVDDWLTDITHDQHYNELHALKENDAGGIYNELWSTWISEHFHEVTADDVYEFAAQMIEDFQLPIFQALG